MMKSTAGRTQHKTPTTPVDHNTPAVVSPGVHHATACVQSYTAFSQGGTPEHHSQDQVLLLEVPEVSQRYIFTQEDCKCRRW